jgi:chaperone BCS1
VLRDHRTTFAEQLPEEEFTTAELQGYLLSHKRDPDGAVKDMMKWIESERAERQRRKEVEEKEKLKSKERAQRMAAVQGARNVQGFGAFGSPVSR